MKHVVPHGRGGRTMVNPLLRLGGARRRLKQHGRFSCSSSEAPSCLFRERQVIAAKVCVKSPMVPMSVRRRFVMNFCSRWSAQFVCGGYGAYSTRAQG